MVKKNRFNIFFSNNKSIMSAVDCKMKGNNCFKAKDYVGALRLYSKGIESVDRDKETTLAAVLYSNRAQAHLKSIDNTTSRSSFVASVSALSDEMAQLMWESEVLRHLDKAVRDCRVGC